MSTARIETQTRTIHTISVSIPDDILAPLDGTMDEVEIVLVGRHGMTVPKKLAYRDLRILLGER